MRSNMLCRYACVWVMIAASVLPGCKGCDDDQAAKRTTFRTGAILPLTGDLASYGQRTKNGIELAVDEWNTTHLDGPQVQVVYEDNVGKPKDSVNAYQKLRAVQNVPLIFGAASSPETLAIVPIANRDTVVVFSSISSSPELARVGGDYFFRIVPSDSFQAVILADWMQTLSIKKVAVMYLNNSWGVELLKAFEPRFVRDGGSIVATETCDSGNRDFRAQITKMLAAKPDAIWAPTYGKEGGLFLKQLKEAGYTGPVFGGDVWSSPELIEVASNAAEGARFVVAADFSGPEYERFAKAYEEKYGSKPDVYASLAYDMARIVCEGIGQGKRTGPELQKYLASMPPYEGVTGKTQFDQNGDVVGKAFSRKIYRDGKAVTVN